MVLEGMTVVVLEKRKEKKNQLQSTLTLTGICMALHVTILNSNAQSVPFFVYGAWSA